MRASVIIITTRYGGLGWQLRMLSKQTVKDFNVIVCDGCWNEREAHIIDLAEHLDLDLIYLREEFPFAANNMRAISENRCIEQVEAPYVIFLDDYEVVADNHVEEHLKILEAGYAGISRRDYRKFEGPNVDYSEKVTKTVLIDERLKHLWSFVGSIHTPEGWLLNVPHEWWQPSTSSCATRNLFRVGGFNELFCGGQKREDADLSFRLSMDGVGFAFNPNLIVNHIHHGDWDDPVQEYIEMRTLPHRVNGAKCNYEHPPREGTGWWNYGYQVHQCSLCGELYADSKHLCEVSRAKAKARTLESLRPPPGIVFPGGFVYKCTNLKEGSNE